ncbi:MAG: LytTR family DNA-binding domain-containing protein [Eubacteriales bacterium]|nr:LytTR family DNA-binding domain-containing protein [Eubacteriales bacterium]
MKINEYMDITINEDRIDYYYQKRTNEVHEILGLLRKYNHKLIGKTDNGEIIFSINDVYYFESVDKKTFAYLRNVVLKIEVRLSELENAYYEYGFIRVNKSTVLNVYKINSLKSELNMKVIALLDNGERVQINRSYKSKFNLFLKTMNEERLDNEINN